MFLINLLMFMKAELSANSETGIVRDTHRAA